MQSEFANDFRPHRGSDAVQLYAYALLGMGATILFLAMFLHTPIGTEARDYIFYRGYLGKVGSWRELFFPQGINHRLVSMAAFAFARDACGFGETCLDVIQITILLACVLVGAVHLHQLWRRPVLVAACMALWCLSLPVFGAGFWQATQHDKLAFLFSLAALSLGFSAMRRQVRGTGLVITTFTLLVLFVLALNAKEIAFFLPVAALAQILLLGPAGSLRQRINAARVYLLPLCFAVLYIVVYMARLQAVWQGHVFGGDLSINARYYLLGLMGRQISSVFTSVLALVVLTAAAGYAAAEGRGNAAMSGGLRVLGYLAAILATNLVLVARALYPDNFYLFTAEWAFIGLVATASLLLWQASRVPRFIGLGAIGLLLVIFAHKRFGDMFVWGSGEILRESRVLDADYARLRPYCGPQMAQGLRFVFPERPLGYFYFFRGGSEEPEQLIAPFICEDGVATPVGYSFTGDASPDRPGELVVAFNKDLSIREISKK